MEISFGEKIRLLREERELNQTELGKAVHMTQRKVSYIECGKYEPSMEDIKALCLFFHVSADYLLGFPKGLPYPKSKCSPQAFSSRVAGAFLYFRVKLYPPPGLPWGRCRGYNRAKRKK